MCQRCISSIEWNLLSLYIFISSLKSYNEVNLLCCFWLPETVVIHKNLQYSEAKSVTKHYMTLLLLPAIRKPTMSSWLFSSLLYHFCSHMKSSHWLAGILLLLYLSIYLDQIFSQTQTCANIVTNHTLLVHLYPWQSSWCDVAAEAEGWKSEDINMAVQHTWNTCLSENCQVDPSQWMMEQWWNDIDDEWWKIIVCFWPQAHW